MKKISVVIGIFIVMPIWFYLLYQVLVKVNASELMWFLYWVYIPAALFVGVVTKIAEGDKK